jgi:hypothetical protein
MEFKKGLIHIGIGRAYEEENMNLIETMEGNAVTYLKFLSQ